MTDRSSGIIDLSPEQLELLVLQASKKRKERPRVSIPPQPRSSNIFPMSYAQEQLWFIDQLSFAQEQPWLIDQPAPGTAAYTMPAAVRLAGPLDEVALQQSLDAISRRHEILRTTFTLVDGRPVQVIAPAGAAAAPITLLDMSELPLAERESKVQQLASTEAQRRFDLAHGPLIHVTLLRLGATEHVLILVMHHIISDVWSTGIFIQEIIAHYVAYRSGRPASLPDLPIQYADYSVWQREWLQGKLLEDQIAYWKGQLADLPVLQLPTDRPRPPVASFRGALQPFALPASLSEGLRALSQQEGATLYMTLLAAFQTLLHRYSAQEDIVVGTGVANRNRSEIEPLIGCFVNILVMRADFTSAPTFRELLGRVRKMCLDAYAHQGLPFELLVGQLQPDRDLSYNPLAQVAFVLQTAAVEIDEFQGLKLSLVPLEHSSAQFDLSLHIWDRADGLIGSLEYATDLFDAATIERMLQHFQVLLEGMVANPDQPVAMLPLLTEPEWRQLAAWNATETEFPRDTCLQDLFEAQARRDPTALALIYRDERLTYGELNQRANQLAQRLRSLGVGPEVLVGLCIERSIELAVGILGILKAGGAYVPLDPMYPPERLAFMLADAQAPVLLTQAALLSRLPGASSWGQPYANLPPQALGYQPTVICLDADWATIARESTASVESGVTAENLSYVIYTSGSTGRPKGVAVTHRNVVRLVCETGYARFGPDQTFLQLAPIAFDAATFEVWGALLHGARLVIAPPQFPTPTEIGQLIQRHQVSILWLTAGLFHNLVETAPDVLRGVHQLLAGGDVVSSAHVRQLRTVLPSIQVINGYGPTECTTFTCCYPVDAATPLDRSIPIGRPIANAHTYILDQHLAPAPVGVAGELYIGGDGLARGYLNRPDLTAEKFLPNPFVIEDGGWRMEDRELPSSILHPPSSRLYKTGDLARYLPDGNVEFLGRSDTQVKLRGFRIELDEIAAALRQHTGVGDAVVMVREDRSADKRLVAYIVPTNDQRPTTNDQRQGDTETRRQGESKTEQSAIYNLQSAIPETLSSILNPQSSDLRAFLKQRLPEYMVPSAFVLLDALPLTPNGKVDRGALPAPDTDRPDLEKSFVAPRTPEETALAQIWSEILVLDQIGIHDNFFELGGHSLLAIEVLARMRDRYQVELSLMNLFESPTIAELATMIVQQQVEQTDHASLEQMLAEIEHISEDDAQTLLETEPQTEQDEELDQLLTEIGRLPQAELSQLLVEDDTGEQVDPDSLDRLLADLEGLSDEEVQTVLGAIETR